MGCFHPKQKIKLYPLEKTSDKSAHSDFVHYLTEAKTSWQLVVYNIEEKKFMTLKLEKNQLLSGCETVIVDGILFCAGGIKTSPSPVSAPDLKAVLFQIEDNHIRTLPQMREGRCKHGMTSIANKAFYVLGGVAKEKGLIGSCEEYDISTSQWKRAGFLTAPRASVSACSFSEKLIYAFGGFGSAEGNTVGSKLVEILNITNPLREWLALSYKGDYVHFDNTKLWCTQIDERQIIIFGTEKTTLFDTETQELTVVMDANKRIIPDKRGEVKLKGEEVLMILEAGGNLGIYDIKAKKSTIQPHLLLGL